MDENQARENEKYQHKSKPYPIVAIGASAGGLESVTKLLENLPHNTGMAYVYIQHLDPDRHSMLVEILQRATKMKVQQAENLMPIEANNFFIIPPNKDMCIVDGVLKLIPRAARPAKQLPIDKFFLSLADKQKEGAIGIVLSGTASDGAKGLKAIKEGGGLTYAQDDSAQFNSMPQAAIAEGSVDQILPPAELAKELERLGKLGYILSKGIESELIEEPEEEDKDRNNGTANLSKNEDITGILRLLKTGVGVDFSHYKKNTIQRRIFRRMILNKLDNLKDYIELLTKNSKEVTQLYRDLLINVTHFFRDSDACDYLKKELLPKLLQDRTASRPLRIWVPACSTGEEVYSLAMLALEVLGENAVNANVQIFATDLSEAAINKARIGLYTIADVANVTGQRLNRFFNKVDGAYRIVKAIRDVCVFAPHNVFKDPPFSRVDLISCCNLLIYLDNVLQKKVFANFHYSLVKNGYLILGKSETNGSSAQLFTPADKKAKVYIKKSDVASKAMFDLNYNVPRLESTEAKPLQKNEVKEGGHNPNLEKKIDEVLLSQYVPPAIVVTHDLEIVQFRGSTGLYLEPSSGKASLNLLKWARTGLALELRSAANKVIKTGEPEKREGIEINYQGKVHQVCFQVTSLSNIVEDQLLLIVFEETKTGVAPEQKATHSKHRRVKQLEDELVSLREDLRAIVEEQEASTEELQSANEEIVSSNEELQSINEELETSKEELESSNEELMTINQELQARNEQLSESHDYSQAVVATIREAVLLLDGDLKVKTANKSFYTTFKAKPEKTEGRIIYEIGNKEWNISALKELLEVYLRDNDHIHSFELKHSFTGIGEKVMMLNARRIIQRYNGQPVILLAIEDITEHKQAEKLLEEREEWLRKMTNNVPVMIWVSGPDKNFNFLNKTWLAFTGRSLRQETGIGWTEGVHAQDLPLCLSTYHKSFEEKKPFNIEYRMKRHDGEYRWILNSAVPTFDTDGEFSGYTGTCIEIHDQRLLSEDLERRVFDRTRELEEANNNLERINNELQQFAYVASHDLQEPLRKILTFSNRLKEKDADALSDAGKEYVEKIRSSSERMRHLIDDLLNFSRISRFDKKFILTDLNKIFKDVSGDFDLLIQEKNAIVQVGKLPVLQAIPLQINQLFHNLLSNALKFTSPHNAPEINVSCKKLLPEELKKYTQLEPSTDYYEIEFRDNGIGFPQEFADQVFVIFQRLNEKEQYPGTGIGLALCRKIVRNHLGEIFAESEEGKGSVFRVILPAQEPWTAAST